METSLLYPFIFSIHPIIFLYVHNLKNACLPFLNLIYCLTFFLALSFILYFLFKILIKDRLKTGLFLAVFMLFIYIPLWRPVNLIHIDPFALYILNIIIIFIIIILLHIILLTKKKLEIISIVLNYIAISLVVITITIGFIDYYRQNDFKLTHNDQKTFVNLGKNGIVKNKLPNIVYIIFDAYADETILKELYAYDNCKFISFLEKKGFYIVKNGRSNYDYTEQSLASSLNFDYMEEFGKQIGGRLADKRPFIRLIRENKVRQFLARRGYTFIALSSGSYSTELYDADVYINPVTNNFYFENMVFSNTILNPLFGKLTTDYQIKTHKERILKNFDKIPVLAQSKSPFFIFAHFICPHPPFVFGKTIFYSKLGDIMLDQTPLHEMDKKLQKKYIRAYAEQVNFLNKKIMKMIEDIFRVPINPPIIILQGDHGPRSATDFRNMNNTNWRERFSILNAIYLPGKKNVLYEGITPVNTFRIIFNEYFATNYQKLPDKTIF